MSTKIPYITGNEMKFKEAKAVLGDRIEWVKIDLPEIQSLDPNEVLTQKANEALKHREEFIIEDISFYLHCLNKLPGPLVKSFLSTLGTKGLYELAHKYKDYEAETLCSVCYVKNRVESFFFEGRVYGRVIKPTENSTYQWDSLFRPTDAKKPFSELMLNEKNRISPRGIALSKLKEFFDSLTK